MVGNQPTRLVYGEDDDSFSEKYPVLETFMHAADSFVKHVGGDVQIWAANRDWFLEEWGRDTFISFTGILKVNKRFDEAKQVVRDFATYEKNGLIANRNKKNTIEYNSGASTVVYPAMKSYWKYMGDCNFVTEMLPVCRRIIDAYKHGTSYERFGKKQTIKMDENDALIVSASEATWMDADLLALAKQS